MLNPFLLIQKFKNEQTVWDPGAYDDWDYVAFDPQYFWKPDLFFMNW